LVPLPVEQHSALIKVKLGVEIKKLLWFIYWFIYTALVLCG